MFQILKYMHIQGNNLKLVEEEVEACGFQGVLLHTFTLCFGTVAMFHIDIKKATYNVRKPQKHVFLLIHSRSFYNNILPTLSR